MDSLGPAPCGVLVPPEFWMPSTLTKACWSGLHVVDGEPGVEHEPLSGSPALLRGGLGVGVGGVEYESIPELAKFGFLGLGDDAVGRGAVDAKLLVLLEGLVDGVPFPQEFSAVSARESQRVFSSNLRERAASAASSTIRFQPASKVRRQSGWSRAMRPALLPQYRQVPAAVLSRLEKGMDLPIH